MLAERGLCDADARNGMIMDIKDTIVQLGNVFAKPSEVVNIVFKRHEHDSEHERRRRKRLQHQSKYYYASLRPGSPRFSLGHLTTPMMYIF